VPGAIRFGFRSAIAAALTLMAASLMSSPVWAGDDGSAPIWQGIGSIFGPVIGFGIGGGDKPPPIDYREHGKLVLPHDNQLPPPGSSAASDPSWPVNQEIVRKKALKEEQKKTIAGVGDARQRYNHGFPTDQPVTVRAVTPDGQTVSCGSSCGSAGSSSSMISNLNPLNWVGMGKSAAPLGPEPDREWLTDPPKGFRAPVEPAQGSDKN
jgi:hypothetical protein